MNLPPHQYYGQNGDILTYDVEYYRTLKINEISEWQAKQLELPVQFAGHLFDFDQTSQFRVLAVVMIGNGSPTGFWTTANNIDVPADNEFMTGLYTAMLTKVSIVHGQQRSMKNAILAMSDVEQIANYGVPQ